MNSLETIELQVRDILDRETSAITLSDKLFSPHGLFNTLAANEDERRALVRSPLFKEAQKRFRYLQKLEMAAFAKSIDSFLAPHANGDYAIRLEARRPAAVAAPD